MQSKVILIAVAAAAAGIWASDVHADSVFFKDGRHYEVPKLVEHEDHLEAIYKNGISKIRRDLVKDYFIDSAGSTYQPKDEDEAAKIEKGLVPFEDKWIPRAKRDRIVQKRNEVAVARLDEYRAHQKWRNRYEETTKHFDFEFTVPFEVGENYMDMFEVYYGVFAKEWRIKQPKGDRLKVCFYNNRDDFQRIGNVGRGVLGYFRFVEPLELNFFYERRDERLTLDVLFHELNHYLFHLYTAQNYQFAPWIEEGMAEYYGASTWDPKTKKMMVGNIQEGRLVALMSEMDGGEEQDLISLMREPVINATQYAWSWSLCHMLMEDKKYRPKFKKYVERMGRGKVAREANPRNQNFQWAKRDIAIEMFQSMVGVKDLDAFEKQWYEYIRQLDVQSARGYHQAALFYVRWDRPIRAGMNFKQAIDMYSNNPSTYEEYGKLLTREKKAGDAIPILEKGIGLDPLNPHLYRELGRAYRAMDGESNKEQGKRYQLMAVEMDPNDGSLLFGLDSDVLAEIED